MIARMILNAAYHSLSLANYVLHGLTGIYVLHGLTGIPDSLTEPVRKREGTCHGSDIGDGHAQGRVHEHHGRAIVQGPAREVLHGG